MKGMSEAVAESVGLGMVEKDGFKSTSATSSTEELQDALGIQKPAADPAATPVVAATVDDDDESETPEAIADRVDKKALKPHQAIKKLLKRTGNLAKKRDEFKTQAETEKARADKLAADLEEAKKVKAAEPVAVVVEPPKLAPVVVEPPTDTAKPFVFAEAKPVKPKVTDFADPSEYETAIAKHDDAMDDWRDRRDAAREAHTIAVAEARADAKISAERAANGMRQAISVIYERGKALFGDKYGQALDKHIAAKAEMSPTMNDFIFTAGRRNVDLAAKLSFALADDPVESTRIACLPPTQAATELGLLLARLETPAAHAAGSDPPAKNPAPGADVAAVTSAAQPFKPGGSGAVIPAADASASPRRITNFDDYVVTENRKAGNSGGRRG